MIELKNGDYHTDWLDRMVNWVAGDKDGFIPSSLNFAPRSLISVIIPGPKVLLRFVYRGKPFNCVVPLHYTDWDIKNERVLGYLNDYLLLLGFSAAIVRTLPQKMLAVHCGLCLYGRNNICYSCHACVSSCLTGAIAPDRRLVNSDRCLTLADESPGDFPEWVDVGMHNSIVGCTKCQDCRPGNARNIDNVIDGVSFTEDETAELINNLGDKPYSDGLAAKIEATGIPPEYGRPSVLPRNLAALLQKTQL